MSLRTSPSNFSTSSNGFKMESIRISAGSASLLGLQSLKMEILPTCVHLLQYSPMGCSANCAFCPQARQSIIGNKRWLSRVSWPRFPWNSVKTRIQEAFQKGICLRVCLQTVLCNSWIDDMVHTARDLLQDEPVPMSIAMTPVNRQTMEILHDIGVDRIGIALDASSKGIFSNIKGRNISGPFRWENHLDALQEALEVFGKGRVTTHLIVGLGETEKQFTRFMQEIHDQNITLGLFAFTPIRGTALALHPRPTIECYRRMQLARFLITRGFKKVDDFSFDKVTGKITGWGMERAKIEQIVRESKGRMFETTGCPGCNRPFYTSKPGGTIYNHPAPLSNQDITSAIKVLFQEEIHDGDDLDC